MAGKLTCVNIEVTKPTSEAGGSIVGPDADWIFNSDWKWRKMPDGTVEVRNSQTSPGPQTLPGGYRPSDSLSFAVRNSAGTGVVFLIVDTLGVIHYTGSMFSGNVIRFYAEA